MELQKIKNDLKTVIILLTGFIFPISLEKVTFKQLTR